MPVSWNQICIEFEKSFEKKALKKKAHFDCCGENDVIDIDGITLKWCSAILLDAIVCFHVARSQYSTRRGFDQHLHFKESVLIVIKRAVDDGALTCPPNEVTLNEMDQEWASFDAFQTYFAGLFHHMKQCTKEKVQKIAAATCRTHENLSLAAILNSVVRRIVLSSNLCLQNSKVAVVKNASSSTTIEGALDFVKDVQFSSAKPLARLTPIVSQQGFYIRCCACIFPA